MMKSIEILEREIIWLFEAFNGEPVAVVADPDTNLKIGIEFYSADSVSDIDEVEYFCLYCGDVELSTEDFDTCLEYIHNIYTYIDEQKTDYEELRKYYSEHIANHTEAEFKLGSIVFQAIFKQFLNNADKNTNLVDFLNSKLDNLLPELFPDSNVEELKSALDLSMCWDTYSDFYKSLYHVRPHFPY